MKKNKILIVGLFLSSKNANKIYRTAADQLAELLQKNNYQLIKVSYQVGKVKRLLDTCFTILFKSPQYKIGIVPLYGGTASLLWASLSVWLMNLLGKKTILIIHGGSIPQRMKIKSDNYLRVIKKVDVVVCPSNFIIQTLKKYNIESVLIENVLNLNDYQFHNKNSFRPKLFWMRTFEDAYNPLMAVRVLTLLKKKYTHAALLMAGRDDGLLTATKQLAIELNVIDDIIFPGYINYEEKNKYADEYDIHICTNKIDNAPVSIIEMMCLGLPIVTVNTGGIPFLVDDGSNALLVEFNNSEAMADKISEIINDAQLGKSLVSKGLQTSKQYGEMNVIAKWEAVFKRLN